MAKEPKTVPKPEHEPELKAKPKERRHYPQYEYMITSGFHTMNPMGLEGWEYVDLWDASSAIMSHGNITRRGSDPFLIWRRQLD